jgi:hypothetical protein
MSSSAIVMGIAGIVLSFSPQEFANYFKMGDTNMIVLQLLGGAYFGFAMLNWMAKANLTGGIYSRPVAIGNFTQFSIGGLALLKLAVHGKPETYTWIAALLYSAFAILFGIVMFTNPFTNKN